MEDGDHLERLAQAHRMRKHASAPRVPTAKVGQGLNHILQMKRTPSSWWGLRAAPMIGTTVMAGSWSAWPSGSAACRLEEDLFEAPAHTRIGPKSSSLLGPTVGELKVEVP